MSVFVCPGCGSADYLYSVEPAEVMRPIKVETRDEYPLLLRPVYVSSGDLTVVEGPAVFVDRLYCSFSDAFLTLADLVAVS